MINNLNCENKRKNINNCYSNLKSYINYTQQIQKKKTKSELQIAMQKSKQKFKIKI